MIRRTIFGLITVAVAVVVTGCGAKEQVKLTPTELTVKQDKSVADKIMDNIKHDALLKDRYTSFQVMNVRGEATIYGVVNSELEREHAEQIAQDMDGVKSVTSRIKLRGDVPATQTASANSSPSVQ